MMNSLPPELTHIIISYLPTPLARYATVSQSWQPAIEARTFSHISISSDDDAEAEASSFAQFKQAFAHDSPHGPRRQTLVRYLRFYVALPVVSQKRLHKMQSTKEAAANNVAYTQAVAELFGLLSTWHGRGRDNISLEIIASASTDNYSGNDAYATHGTWSIRNDSKYVGFDAGSLAALLPPDGNLAVVGRVGSLTLGSDGRRMDPAVLQVLGRALPSVEKMDLSFFPVGRRLMELRRELRSSLADALSSFETALVHLTFLKIYWEDSDPGNQQFPPGDMVQEASSGGDGKDALSAALSRISRLPSLCRLELEGCHVLSPEIFGEDRDGSGEDSSAAWPSLTTLSIQSVSLTTPDGGWYVTGDPSSEAPGSETGYSSDYEAESVINSEDSDESDYAPERKWERQDGMSRWHEFRRAPDDEKIVPFMVAMARAVSRMPKLQRMDVIWHRNMECSYYGRGEECWISPSRPDYEEDSIFFNSPLDSPRWVFHLEEGFVDWEFPPELKEALTESVGAGMFVFVGLGRWHGCPQGLTDGLRSMRVFSRCWIHGI